MDEAQAKQWLQTGLDVSRETINALDHFVALLLYEAAKQNLIARSTVDTVWGRHIVDSAQLLPLSGLSDEGCQWIDLGSGPGLPGIVLALISNIEIALVESRTRRVEFLNRCVEELGLSSRVTVEGKRLEKVDTRPFDVIAARAFAPLPKLFSLAHRFAHDDTVWILPKGKSVEGDLAAANHEWHGDFETVQSATDPESFIVVARNVRPRRRS